MKPSKKIKMIIEKTNTGFSAFGDKYPIFTTGGSIPEFIENSLEASNLFFEDEDVEISYENLEFEIDSNREIK